MDPKDYHLEKLGRRGKTTIWLVDGDKVRSEIDPGFEHSGRHFHFNFVPEDEFWIDRQVTPTDRKLYIDSLLSEEELKVLVKDCRLEKVSRRGRIAVWVVDGTRIRDEVDPEFTNFAEHYRFNYIPEFEFWIDKESVPDERGFFIDHLLTEWKLLRAGWDVKSALEQAGKVEQLERDRHKMVKKLADKPIADQREALRKRPLGKTAAGFSVWLVDGKLVRSLLEINFTEGGHHLIYPFVPADEVWIDDDLAAAERPFVLLHELYEHGLMDQGLDYDAAHGKASRLEWRCRHEVKNVDTCLADLGWVAEGTASLVSDESKANEKT